ncbi:MAG: hypothetical protein B7Z55_06765, partial [Planctomycetales bacterium 12-60-4]
AVEELHRVVKSGATPQSQILALWSLEGLKKLTVDDVIAGFQAADPRVREQAVRLSEEFTSTPDKVLPAVVKLTDDPNLRVRWQVAFSLGEFDNPLAAEALLKLASQSGSDGDMRIAILSSIPKFAGDFVSLLLSNPETAGSPLTGETIASIGSGADGAETEKVFAVLFSTDLPAPIRNRHLGALGEGLKRRGTRLSALAMSSNVSSDIQTKYRDWLKGTMETAQLSSASLSDRLAAIDVLSGIGTPDVFAAFEPLLDSKTAPELQERAAQALAAASVPAAMQPLMAKWKGLGPKARRDAIDRLTQSSAGAKTLLTGLEESTIRSAELDRDKQQLLLSYPDPSIRDRASKVLGVAGSNRKAVVATYQTALQMDGDATRGRAVYTKICIQCHRAGTEGHAVGPDMVSFQNKSPDDLLVAILDPNREAQAIYTTYTALTLNGQVASGIIAAESAASLTLRRAEAKEDVVLRDQLDELLSNGVSLMPEGMEKDLSPQQVADVIAFVKALAPATK